MSEIIVHDMSKIIKNQMILQNINLRMESGKIYGFIGRNGSGKSVLLKCIAGFMKPTSGWTSLDGQIVGKDIKFIKNMGFLINSPGFLPELSGIKNLIYLASFKHITSREQICNVMRMVELDPENKKGVGKYSTGMIQRLGIAQAIMENPDILILDEPMNGLDENMVVKMRNLFLDLKREGKMILITSHIKEDIDILCDEVYKIQSGKIIEKF